MWDSIRDWIEEHLPDLHGEPEDYEGSSFWDRLQDRFGDIDPDDADVD